MLKGNGFRINRVPDTTYHVLLATAVLAVALSSCAYTKFQDTSRDPAYSGQPKKILIHGVGRNPTVRTSPTLRTIFEDQLVEQLEQHGVGALAGHEFLADSVVLNREAIKQLVKDKEVDAVFIAGPTNRKDLETLRPGETSYAVGLYEGQMEDYDRFSTFVNGAVNSAGTYAGKKVLLEMVLYDVRSDRRIWSALSRWYMWDTSVDAIKPMAAQIVEVLSAEKIIP